MSAKPLSSNLVSLRKDAGKVLEDISRLSKELEALGGGQAVIATVAAKRALEPKLRGLRSNLAGVGQHLQRLPGRVQQHVAEKPYHHAAAVVGLGVVIGMLVRRRRAAATSQ